MSGAPWPPDADVPLSVWRDFLNSHAGREVLEGLVVKVVPFGACVELADGVHGLLHHSEWPGPPVVGSRMPVRIKAVDIEQRRMILKHA